MRVLVTTALFLVICACGQAEEKPSIDALIGTWEVDFDPTMEEMKKSPKYDAKAAERLPAMIKRMMASMTIAVTDKSVIYRRGKKDMSLPYTVASSDTKSLSLTITQESKKTTLVFTLRDKDKMSFKSSASDDMDFYVWKKSSGK